MMERKVSADIKRMKAALKQKAKVSGIYENFGQKEVRILLDKYFDAPTFGNVSSQIDEFSSWCMNYTGEQ